MRRKGGFVLLGIVLFIGFIAGSIIAFIYWLSHFKIHLYQIIIEEYHYNRVQEIPLATISSDFDNETFVEKVNKAYYGFYSQGEIDNFRSKVKDTIIKQVGEGYWWNLVVENLYFGKEPGEEGCKVEKVNKGCYPGPYLLLCEIVCKCSQECGENAGKEVAERVDNCNTPQLLAKCLGSLTINITFFNDTFPLPLIFNNTDKFITKMVFNAYA